LGKENLSPRLGRIGLAAKIAVQALLSPVAFAACGLIVRDGKVLPGGGVARGEPAEIAIIREMKEEIGLTDCAPPNLFGLYSRRSGWATNVIALYRLDDVDFTFTPNFEIREIRFADPLAPPDGTPASVKRRLLEFAGVEPRSPYW
jgi:ADP-ribose pyrophosphatase YjhB (NUDIX family)